MPDITPQFVLHVMILISIAVTLFSNVKAVLQTLIFLTVAFGGGCIIYSAAYDQSFDQMFGKIKAELQPGSAYVEAQTLRYRMAQDGHFHIIAKVNDVPIEFLVDTGASDVTLSKSDAIKAGLKPDLLQYNNVYQTANGQVKGAHAFVSIAIEQVKFQKFKITVNNAEMDKSLMGMRLLSKFNSLEIDGNYLKLVWNGR